MDQSLAYNDPSIRQVVQIRRCLSLSRWLLVSAYSGKRGDREPVWGQRDEITGAPRPVGGTTQSTTAEGARSQAASRGQDAEPSAQSALL